MSEMDWEELKDTEADATRSWSFFKSMGPVEVFHVDLTSHPQREVVAWEWLSSEERRRRERFVYEAPGRCYALCRAAVREILCHQLNCHSRELTFELAEYGKPYAVMQGKRVSIDFNLSHSGSHGLIAFSRQGRVGVDVEERRLRKTWRGLVETVFGLQEQALLAGLRGKRWMDAFLGFWTIKEALSKAWGTGLHTDFSRFQTPPEMRRGELTGLFSCPRLSEATWCLENIGNGEMAGAVAWEAQ